MNNKQVSGEKRQMREVLYRKEKSWMKFKLGYNQGSTQKPIRTWHLVCEIISFAILLIYDWVIHRAVSQCRNACIVSNSYKQILFLIHSNSRKQLPPLISNSLLSKIPR